MRKKGFKHSIETCKKISESRIGKRNSPKTEFKKGHKGSIGILNGNYRKRYKQSEEIKKKISEALKGKKRQLFSNQWKENIAKSHKGLKRTIEQRINISKSKIGDKNPAWQGGINRKNQRTRRSIEYRLWRESVFAKDNWTCKKYRIKGGKLHPHHIKNFSQYPKLRFAIDNGITFSEKAHKEFHKKYGLKNNNENQLKEFLCQKK